jgi:hypothetical protein
MGPRTRKLALTAHVAASVGWLGAVAGFLVLAVAGLRSADAGKVRAAYVAMELLGWDVIVPLSFASLLTGLIQALGTEWGLLRHWWVLIKLLINVASSALLLVHMRPINAAAAAAAAGALGGELAGVRIQLAADAGLALVALLAATALSVYKPRGLTKYGWRKARGRAEAGA